MPSDMCCANAVVKVALQVSALQAGAGIALESQETMPAHEDSLSSAFGVQGSCASQWAACGNQTMEVGSVHTCYVKGLFLWACMECCAAM